MAIGSVLNTGVAGMQRSSGEMQKSAQQIASFAANSPEQGTGLVAASSVSSLAEPIVNMKFEQLIFEASAKVVSSADDALGTLIDIKA